MLTIAICDDEKPIIEKIKETVIDTMKERDNEYQIVEFKSGEEVIEYTSSGENEIDILFLDIQMDGMDGMETARRLREYDRTTEIIFVTSIGEMWSEGYTVRAFRFIEKPVNRDIIRKNLSECLVEIVRKRGSFLIVKTDTGTRKVYSRDIVCIEAMRKMIKIYTRDEVLEYRYTLTEVMKNIEEQLFVQCHRSYLANLIYIKEVGSKDILMKNGLKVPISRSKHKEVLEKYFRTIGAEI